MAKEKKVKEVPWTEQKMLHKYDQDGVLMPDVYRKFGWETWKRMTEGERAMWTEASEATPAPISLETIDFNKKLAAKADKIVKPKSQVGEIPDVFEDEDIDTSKSYTEEEQKDAIKKQLKKLGIRFTHNSKFETLRKKLADADNPE